MWPAASVNASVPLQSLVNPNGTPVLNEKGEPKVISAAAWLDQNRSIHQMTWAPGELMIVQGRVTVGWGMDRARQFGGLQPLPATDAKARR